MRFGDYPEGYNAKTHGPFDPARYYGKSDTPFGDVQLKDLGTWISRRNISPRAMTGAIARAYWRWQHKYVQPRKGGMAPFFHVVVGAGVVFYLLNYNKMKRERHYEYHW